MMRWMMSVCLVAAPLFGVAALSGCKQNEVKYHHTSERVEESEPQMVSPGQEVLVPD